ncbi:MAG: exodeoxyribonuclease VII small subunit [Bacteriovorax sp. MedPE-SWde]|nr:MAG: exodeoxyribonuclease VII small subunit [Bacteriovorax sp. MedPE-SWde]
MAKKINFEKNLENLETIVAGLETGELSLDESINNFEEGVKLYTDCKKYLGEVEKKITVLTESLEEKEIDA